MASAKHRRKVTRIQVAQRAGVSPSTVTRALNAHPRIPDRTRQRIRRLAREMGYVPSTLARSYFQNRSFRIGVVIPFESGRAHHPLPYEYFAKTLFGLNEAARGMRYSIGIFADNGLSAAQLARLVQERAADGLVFLANVIGDPRFALLHRERVPFVFVHHYVRNKPYPFVDCDARAGMAEAFEHIIAGGVRSVGFLGGGDRYINSIDRKRFFRQLAEQHGLHVSKVLDGDYSRRSGYLAAAQFLAVKRGPDLVLCANDRMAFGLLEGLRDAGRRVPQEMKVIGFDDLEIAQMAVPPLTTIENPFFEIGRTAAKLLIGAITGQPAGSARLPTRLIVRESA